MQIPIEHKHPRKWQEEREGLKGNISISVESISV